MLEKLINGYFLIVKNTLMPFRRVLLPTLSYRFHYKSSILAWNEILFERAQNQVLALGAGKFSSNISIPSVSHNSDFKTGEAITTVSTPKDSTNPKPITYCASVMFVCPAPPSQRYCCSTSAVGGPIKILCPDGRQTGVFVGLKPSHSHIQPKIPMVQIPKVYQPKYRHRNGRVKHLPVHRFHPNDDSSDVMNQKAKAMKYFERLSKVIPSQNEGLDQSYEMPSSGYKKRIPRSLVKRSTDSDFFVQDITVMEPNVVVYNHSAEYNQPYFICSVVDQSFTFNLPISHATPPSTPMTLRFRLAEEAKVILCSVPNQNVTFCPLSTAGDESSSVLTYQTGYEAQFELYLSNYVQGDYEFRIVSMNEDSKRVCTYDYNDSNASFLAFNFHVYRVCPNKDSNSG